MLASLMAAFKLPDLRKRILFVFGMFAVFVVGLHIPVPGIDRAAMEKLFSQGSGVLGLVDIFSGGALRKFTIFAMGIAPYINASIIMQLLTVAVPQLEALAKEGEHGRKKISQYTRYMTVILAAVQAFGITRWFVGMDVLHAGVLQQIQIIITLSAGTAFLMWVGEQITDKGIGNGVSMVIFAGIVASLPFQLKTTIQVVQATHKWPQLIFLVALFIATIVGIVAIQQAQRKIPIQHVKRVVGNKMYGGSTTFLPLRVNSAGVIPIIFAISIQLFPATIAQFVPGTTGIGGAFKAVANWLNPVANPWAGIPYALFIIFFTYFYTAVTFNVPEVAENLKKYGSFIPGIRPGKPTLEYLDRVMSRITLAGAVFLALIALMQYWSPALTGITSFQLAGGTSLLILVGVALETMQAIEAHLLMRHYEGFIK